MELIGYVIEGKKTFNADDRLIKKDFNTQLEDGRCHGIEEFDDWKFLLSKLKIAARSDDTNIEGKGKDVIRILNNKVLMATTNKLSTINTKEQVIRQYLFANVEGWASKEGEKRKGILKKRIIEFGIQEMASQFLNYIFSFFDFHADYSRIERMDDALIKEIAKNYSIEGKTEKIYEEHFKDYTTRLEANNFLNILIKENIIEDCKQMPRKDFLVKIFNAGGFNVTKNRSGTGWFYRIDPIENED
jgi:hypothetical protein